MLCFLFKVRMTGSYLCFCGVAFEREGGESTTTFFLGMCWTLDRSYIVLSFCICFWYYIMLWFISCGVALFEDSSVLMFIEGLSRLFSSDLP